MADNDSPFARSDPTLLRPRPGGGKRGSGDTSLTPRAAPEVGDVDPVAPEARALLGVGLNPLVQAASPLLLLTGQLRAEFSPMDVTGLRRHALDEIHRFEEHAEAAGCAERPRAYRPLRAVRGCGRSRVIDPVGCPE